ncbi:transmembrane protein 272-like [Astyanax mexicanus]|uniref:transmembrane protein 272-like n=1 Tax=Astyanax mexicanus TaxID=7994 RepID=UPI0020CB2047|nr:transmembrane protein 272-like [Astyanax mexicanus]
MDVPDVRKIMTIPCLLSTELPLMAIPIAQIVIGAMYLNECPKQHYIPVYLVVCGVFGIVISLLSCLSCQNVICTCINGLISTFTVCWFISGSVWIYSIYPPNYNSTLPGEPYCNKTLYQFAFWTTTVGYIVIAVSLVLGCCFLIGLCVHACRK